MATKSMRMDSSTVNVVLNLEDMEAELRDGQLTIRMPFRAVQWFTSEAFESLKDAGLDEYEAEAILDKMAEQLQKKTVAAVLAARVR